MTLQERITELESANARLTAELAEQGIKSNARAVWVFVHAEGLSFKKNPAA